MSRKVFRLMIWFVADVANILCSKFEEFRATAFAALQKLAFPLRVLGDVQDGAEHFSVGLLALNWVEIGLELNFLAVFVFSMKVNISKLGPFPQEISNGSYNFSFFQMKASNNTQ